MMILSKRTTNGYGALTSYSIEGLRALDAGKGEKIPFLREVLDVVQRRAFINVELKGAGTALPARELILCYIQQRGWSLGDFIFSSFDHSELLKAASSGIPIGPLWNTPPSAWIQEVKSLRSTSVHVSVKAVTARFVEKAHSENLKVFAYTANLPADIEAMRQLDVDGVFTDFPERVARV